MKEPVSNHRPRSWPTQPPLLPILKTECKISSRAAPSRTTQHFACLANSHTHKSFKPVAPSRYSPTSGFKPSGPLQANATWDGSSASADLFWFQAEPPHPGQRTPKVLYPAFGNTASPRCTPLAPPPLREPARMHRCASIPWHRWTTTRQQATRPTFSPPGTAVIWRGRADQFQPPAPYAALLSDCSIGFQAIGPTHADGTLTANGLQTALRGLHRCDPS